MLKLYNTATRKKENFKPIKKKHVGIYTCGPTVYDYTHIGNLRAYIVADLLQRYLKYKGYKVCWVMNLTDVDDKTIAGAKRKRVSLDEYTAKYKKAFISDVEAVNVQKCSYYAEATQHIPEMVDLVKTLLKRGYAYRSNGSIYFNISKFKKYGKFAKLNLSGTKPGARIDADSYEKEDVRDFVLWKEVKKGEPFWHTVLGNGRPGWHLECSVMSAHYLGQPFDIHTGGVDLIFPHHQNEIAQSEAGFGKKLAKFWIHNEHLLVDGRKMSKSLGNFYTLRDIEKKNYSPVALRYLFLTAHYRDKQNFTYKSLEGASLSLSGLLDFVRRLFEVKRKDRLSKKVEKLVKKARNDFEKYLNDDLNVPKALAVMFKMINDINKLEIEKLSEKDAKLLIKTIFDFDRIFGLEIKHQLLAEEGKITKEVMKRVAEREKLRKEGKFNEADSIRKELIAQGIQIEDTKNGPRLSFKTKSGKQE